MYKTFFLFFSIILFSSSLLFSQVLVLTPKERLWLQNHPSIRVSNEDNWPPFDFSVDGKPRGYSVEIVKLLAQKIGIEVEFVNGYTWAELLVEFDKRNIDLMHCMTKDTERESKYSFSKPYMPWRISYFLREDTNNINSTEDFIGKKVAAGEGWSTTKLLKKIYPQLMIIEYPNSIAMLEALSNGDVDLLIDNVQVVNYLMSELFISNIKHGGILNLKGKDQNNFHFVSHKDQSELTSIFTKAYDTLSIQKKLQLQQKWFVRQTDKISLNIKNYKYNDLPKLELTDKEREYLHNKKIITMCIDPSWMPYEKFDEDGKYVGMSADFFELFKEDLEIPIEVIKTKTWTESLEAAKRRDCDIFSLAMETPERKKYMNFTTPYLNIPLVMATRFNVGFFDDFSYLKGERIGVVKGYAFNEIIRDKYPNLNIVDVKNLEDGLQKVVDGELFGMVDTIASIGYMFQTKFVGELKIAGKFDEKWELGIGVRNDDLILLEIFEKIVLNIPMDVKQNIMSKFIAIRYEQKMDYIFLLKIFAGILLVVFVILYHNRKLARINKKLEILQKKLKEQAHRDPMTNLYNRRYFHDVAIQVIGIAKREKRDISVLMIDIDKFKSINDTYGHGIGDDVIRTVANILTQYIRSSDIVTRFGGEEFVVLLPNTDIKGAEKIAEKLRTTIKSQHIVLASQNISFSVSIGVTRVIHSEDDIEPALQRADKALYRAKESGRDRVCKEEEAT